MSDIRDMIRVATVHAPAPAAELPEVPLYVDDERPEVTSGSKTHSPWRIEDEGAGEWAFRKRYEAEAEIARITAAHAAERARLLAQIELIDNRVADITMGQRRRSAFFEAVILEWMSRCRSALIVGKAKSRQFLYGTIGWQKAPEKLEYEDEAKALAWARAEGAAAGLYRMEFKLEKDVVKRYAKANKVVPPGARWVGGQDEPWTSVEKPATPPAPRESPPPLQLVKETP